MHPADFYGGICPVKNLSIGPTSHSDWSGVQRWGGKPQYSATFHVDDGVQHHERLQGGDAENVLLSVQLKNMLFPHIFKCGCWRAKHAFKGIMLIFRFIFHHKIRVSAGVQHIIFLILSIATVTLFSLFPSLSGACLFKGPPYQRVQAAPIGQLWQAWAGVAQCVVPTFAVLGALLMVVTVKS